jgi:predicted Zn-dependent protease
MGAAIGAGLLLAQALGSSRRIIRFGALTVAGAWLSASTFTTVRRLPIWSDDFSLFQNIVHANPFSHKAAINLLIEETNRGQYATLERDANEMEKRFPGYFMFTMYDGYAKLRLGSEAEGRRLIELSEQQYQYAADGWRHLASYYLSAGRYPNAIVSLRKATQTEPTQPRNWVMLSEAYLRNRELAKAEEALDHAESIDRHYPDIAVQRKRISQLRQAMELRNRAR